MAFAATLIAGSMNHSAPLTTIVLGPTGPDRERYRVPLGATFEVRIENRSDVTWIPWNVGLAEKDGWCHLVSGSGVSGRPCDVGPHSTIALRPPRSGIEAGDEYPIWFAPPGALYWQTVSPVIVEVVAAP